MARCTAPGDLPGQGLGGHVHLLGFGVDAEMVELSRDALPVKDELLLT